MGKAMKSATTMKAAMKTKTTMKAAMKAAMKKAMKAVKSMKAMKAKRVISKRACRAVVFHGGKGGPHTTLKKENLIKNKFGRIVSKKASAASKKNWAKSGGKWIKALQQARKALKVTGFMAVKKGSPLYVKAR